MQLARLWSDPRRAVSALVVAGYVGLAFAVHDVYPFSRFDMYSQARSSASRVVARTADGSLAEIERFDAWTCDGPIALSTPACPADGSYFFTPYLDAERTAYVASHEGSGGARERIDVVRRIWRLDGSGPPRSTDCLLQICSAVRR